jgi:hypothetical protein
MGFLNPSEVEMSLILAPPQTPSNELFWLIASS